MIHVSSLIKLNILEFTPLCNICNIYGHGILNCCVCNKELCIDIGSIYIQTVDKKPICFNCRLDKLHSEKNCSFILKYGRK